MKYSVSSLTLAALVLGAAPAVAQRPTVRVTPYVGFLAAGSIAQGPFGFEVGNAGAPLYGLQLGYNLTPNIALVGNVGYADSELQAGLPLIGGLSVADSKVLMYDAGVQLRLPITRSGTGLVPFIEGGVGAIRNEITSGTRSVQFDQRRAHRGRRIGPAVHQRTRPSPHGEGPREPVRLR